jgi:ribosomal protein S18 acetylase RimI-like enzyme
VSDVPAPVTAPCAESSLPARSGSLHKRLPVGDPSFWRARLQAVRDAGKPIHTAVYDVPTVDWIAIQTAHKRLLPGILRSVKRPRVLDAGCGYGALLDILPNEIYYTGVDISYDMLEIAKTRYKHHTFYVADLCNTSIPDRSYDFAICRSIDGMIKDNLGFAVWRRMERELLRIADRLVLLQYTEPSTYTFLDAVSNPEQRCECHIRTDRGYLSYRLGQPGTCEIFDLVVQDGYRRQGIATKLIQDLMDGTPDTLFAFCRHNNKAAKGLYAKMGFRFTGLIEDFYPGCGALLAYHNRGRME